MLSDNEPSSPRMNGLTKIALKETNTEALMVSRLVLAHFKLCRHTTSAEAPAIMGSGGCVVL